MPAKNPRLTLTLEPSLKAQIERLSELTGNSQGALVADLLKTSQPVFERMIKVLEAAQSITKKFPSSVSSDLEAAQEQLESQLGIALEIFDDASESLLDKAEQVHRRKRSRAAEGPRSAGMPRPGAASAEALTPSSNRGVRNLTNQVKKSIVSTV